MNYPEFTWIYLILPKFTWIFHNLPAFTSVFLNLPELTWKYLYLALQGWPRKPGGIRLKSRVWQGLYFGQLGLFNRGWQGPRVRFHRGLEDHCQAPERPWWRTGWCGRPSRRSAGRGRPSGRSAGRGMPSQRSVGRGRPSWESAGRGRPSQRSEGCRKEEHKDLCLQRALGLKVRAAGRRSSPGHQLSQVICKKDLWEGEKEQSRPLHLGNQSGQ